MIEKYVYMAIRTGSVSVHPVNPPLNTVWTSAPAALPVSIKRSLASRVDFDFFFFFFFNRLALISSLFLYVVQHAAHYYSEKNSLLLRTAVCMESSLSLQKLQNVKACTFFKPQRYSRLVMLKTFCILDSVWSHFNQVEE